VAERLPGITFFQEVLHILPSTLAMKETEPGLLVMVMPGGYQMFLSAIDLKEAMQKFSWPGWFEAGSLGLTAVTVPSAGAIQTIRLYFRLQAIFNCRAMQ